MKSPDKAQGDYLRALTVIGIILFAVPIIASLVGTLYFALSGGGGLTATPAEKFLFGLIILCGFVTLVYVAVKRFQRGLQGKE